MEQKQEYTVLKKQGSYNGNISQVRERSGFEEDLPRNNENQGAHVLGEMTG